MSISGYESMMNCDKIAKEINKWSDASKLYGDGWYCTKIRASAETYGTGILGGIEVEVTAYITDDDADDNEIDHTVQSYLSDRLDDVERFNPGLLEITEPKIEIVITKK